MLVVYFVVEGVVRCSIKKGMRIRKDETSDEAMSDNIQYVNKYILVKEDVVMFEYECQ